MRKNRVCYADVGAVDPLERRVFERRSTGVDSKLLPSPLPFTLRTPDDLDYELAFLEAELGSNISFNLLACYLLVY